MNNQDAHLLSRLGVTTASAEDVERDVIAAAAQTGRGIRELDSDAQEDEEIEFDAAADDLSHRESQMLNRLNTLGQEIDAVAAGLDSLLEENGDRGEDDAEDAKGIALEHRSDKKERELQRALGEERLASLVKRRKHLSEQLGILQARREDSTEDAVQVHGNIEIQGREVASSSASGRTATAKRKPGQHGKGTLIILDDDDFDSALEAAVETERDRLIRTGVVTPFDRLKGFERRVERVPSINSSQNRTESSIANVAASMAAIANSRPTTKLVDASQLPKLAPPTREFHRLRRIHKSVGPKEKSEKTSKERATKGKKRRRPMPEKEWRKGQRLQSDGEISSQEHRPEEVTSGGEDDEMEEVKHTTTLKLSEADQENTGDDVLLEGGLRIPSSIYDNLFDYQKTGVKWLWELHCQRAGGIIGDEMGLGKTIQVVAFLAALHHSSIYKPSIVICPVTLLRQWKREVRKWYGLFEVEILHDSAASSFKGTSKSRAKKGKGDEIQNEEEDGYASEEEKELSALKRLNRWDALIERIVQSKSGLVVTTYEQLRILREKLLDIEWGYAILDEGHRIRNPDSETTLVCKQLRTVHRIIMTGAPIQNRLTELWSLFDFVFPGKLGVLPIFQAQFALPISIGGYANATPLQVSTAYKCAVVLRDLIMPYLLRRVKSDVDAQLTKKTEHVLFCSLSDEQRSAYRAFLASSEVEQIFDGSRNSLYGIDILRKICNHPDLLEREHSANHPDYGNPERSGKLRVVAQVLDLWKSQGDKVLIFSQTQQMLDIIEDYMIRKDYTYRRMDGSTPVQLRMALVDEFNESSHVFVFILTTKVGGLGTNLIGANKVIIFDPDWNPSTDMQARERAWRIGQTRDVTIYRLITRGTIEEKIYHRQIYKHFLTNKILRDPQQRRFFKARDMRDLFTLNDETHETRTETSTLFAEIGDIDVSNQNEQVHPPKRDSRSGKTKNKIEEEEDQDISLSAGKGKSDVGDDEPQEDESRILKCLFQANGIHSALNHDAIESMNELDKMKVDSDSARVAQQAVEAVRQSRMLRSGDNVAVPTWTGRSGTAGAPVAVRRRFGSTTNPQFVSSSTSLGNDGSLSSRNTTADVAPGLAGASVGRALNSTDVLARIRAGRVGAEVDSLRSDGIRSGGRSGNGRSIQRAMDPEILIPQLRAFIEHSGGSVSSTLLVDEFRDVVPANGTPVFRQLLKQIANLKRENDTEARWVLKAENEQ